MFEMRTHTGPYKLCSWSDLVPLMFPHIDLVPYPSIQATIKQVERCPAYRKAMGPACVVSSMDRIKNHSAHTGDLRYPSSSRYQTPPQLLQGHRFKQWHH